MLPENSPSNTIEDLRADFEKQTGYHQKDSNFLFQSFKTSINWEQNKIISDDTVYVKVNVLDKVALLSTDARQISISNMVWIKAIKVNEVWTYTLLTFIPENTKSGYTGTIMTKSILSGDQFKAYYIDGKLVQQSNGLKASSTERKCTYGIVNGEVNVISCDPPPGDNPNHGGGPIDYETVDPMEHGGAGGSSGGDGDGDGESTNPDNQILDSLEGYPCAQAILAKMPNLENKVSQWLNKTFNNNVDHHIIFRVDNNMEATTDGTHSGKTFNNSSVHVITLNGNMLQTASQEYIAVTMFHEVLHGYLGTEFYRLAQEGNQSQFGVLYPGWSPTNIGGQERYVSNHSSFASTLQDLANALKSFNPSMSNYDALALAKGGVVSNMGQVEISINNNHKNGSAGTKCP
ncbi:hypothetical protein OKW96_16495 [Sphingobacterium sp. KU25419]|nr:hypothetical protein OKW96_16495 [Sphingobacterium sp. KU25419]